MGKLYDFLNDNINNYTFWTTSLYLNIQEIINENSNTSYPYARSRTLNELLRSTVDRYTYTGKINAYQLLNTLCALLQNHRHIKILPGYKLITSEEAENLTFQGVLDSLPIPTNNSDLYINIMHISKGKSYLSKILDAQQGLERLKPIETFAIEGPSHFIRIYRNLGNHNPNDITIFTDIISPHLLETIMVMLPHICNLKEIKTTEDYPELDKNDAEFNKKYTKLMQIFENLFKIYENKNAFDINVANEIIKQIKEYLDMFNFKTEKVNSFLTNLANARNSTIIAKTKETIESTKRNITSYEASLANYYNTLAQAERELISAKTLQPENLEAFIETLQNTKAIEILSSSDARMSLRITAPLQYFLSEDFETYENNDTSEYNSMMRTEPILKRILHKIFVTREYKLLVQGIIRLNINASSYASAPLSFEAQTRELSNFSEFPNPHLYHYNCWDKAKQELIKHLRNNNYELLVMQMVAAVQTVNVAEHASFINGLINDIRNDNFKQLVHIVDTDNRVNTLDEIIKQERLLEQTKKVKEAEELLTANKSEAYTQVEIPDDDENWNEEEVSRETNSN